MKWLVAIPVDTDPDAVRRDVEAAGGALEDRPPVALEPGEQVLFVDGPADLRQRLQASGGSLTVYPDSEQQLY